MTDTKDTTPTPSATAAEKTPLPPSPPSRHPSTQPLAVPGAYSDSKPAPDDVPSPHASQVRPGAASGFLNRALSKDNRRTARRFFSAYAQTWVGMSPVWLMGEALTPGKKVGTQFRKGTRSLADAAEDVRRVVATSGRDVVVIVDEKLRGSGGSGKQMAERTAEVIKAAGENAILVVTASLEKLTTQLPDGKGKGKGKEDGKSKLNVLNLRELAHDPALKRSMQKHGRDALVLLDGALKHPVVVTGVSGFARTRGIPHADALLRLASLGLGKILRALPEDVQAEVSEHAEAKIEEIDAEELERRSTQEERAEAESLGGISEKSPAPEVEGELPGEKDDPYAAMKEENKCIVM
ncbi:hypothetical protein DFH11DRAFT_1748017 [Phellopilus nigrolimitatus]|nr:hypothetical protein DFH11DRAFT_1862958 [Phellopilus nigrolimitatus]KAH8107553.1 hypothetical protein DFH11DRAFT_1748017 [Phellopilus nigrolimitatus]